jgi:hypothetical protein
VNASNFLVSAIIGRVWVSNNIFCVYNKKLLYLNMLGGMVLAFLEGQNFRLKIG